MAHESQRTVTWAALLELTSRVLPLKSTWRRELIRAWTAAGWADLGLQLGASTHVRWGGCTRPEAHGCNHTQCMLTWCCSLRSHRFVLPNYSGAAVERSSLANVTLQTSVDPAIYRRCVRRLANRHDSFPWASTRQAASSLAGRSLTGALRHSRNQRPRTAPSWQRAIGDFHRRLHGTFQRCGTVEQAAASDAEEP